MTPHNIPSRYQLGKKKFIFVQLVQKYRNLSTAYTYLPIDLFTFVQVRAICVCGVPFHTVLVWFLYHYKMGILERD